MEIKVEKEEVVAYIYIAKGVARVSVRNKDCRSQPLEISGELNFSIFQRITALFSRIQERRQRRAGHPQGQRFNKETNTSRSHDRSRRQRQLQTTLRLSDRLLHQRRACFLGSRSQRSTQHSRKLLLPNLPGLNISLQN